MRILVCGGRDYTDRKEVATRLGHYLPLLNVVIHGGARGADTLADEWARANGISVQVYPAEWGKYGKSAGIRRNVEMLARSHPDLVIAFPGGRGTADMAHRARLAGVQVEEVP